MNIIATTDTSRHGTDCYINETISLVEQFGVYAIIVCRKVVGWATDDDIFVELVTIDKHLAMKAYESYTKKM